MAEDRLSLDLVLPGLFSCPGERLPVLERLLARADQHRAPDGCPAVLFNLFRRAPEGPLPVGAVSLLGEEPAGRTVQGIWSRADAVEFVAARDHVLISPTAPLSSAEAAAIAAELEAHFSADGWHALSVGERIYLGMSEAPPLRLPATTEILGHSLGAVLPHDRDHLAWLSLINEIQMLLHGSAVNRAREEAGREPVNGLWLWGAGPLPEPLPAPFAAVWSADPLVRGLARLGGSETLPLPPRARDVLASAPGPHLVVFGEVPCELPEFESDWLAPLHDALRGGRLAHLNLHTADGRRFEISPRGLRRFWRIRRPLQSYRQ